MLESAASVAVAYIGRCSSAPEEGDGYLETIAYDEDSAMWSYYTSVDATEEALLDSEFFAGRGIDWDQLFAQAQRDGVEAALATVNDILAKYALVVTVIGGTSSTRKSKGGTGGGSPGKASPGQHTGGGSSQKKAVARTPYVVTDEQLLGARALLQQDPQFHRRPEVVQTLTFIRASHTIKDKAAYQVAAYLDLVGDRDYGRHLVQHDPRLLSALVIKAEEIPDGYFQNQARVARDLGHGDVHLGDRERRQMAEVVQADQTKSLNRWLTYLNERQYPAWYQYMVVEDLKKMGSYNTETGKYAQRRRGYAGAFPELNREALALCYGALSRYAAGDTEGMDEELLKVLRDGGFKRLYEHFLLSNAVNVFDKTVTEGSWKTYYQAEWDDEHGYVISNEESTELVNSLQGWNTGWCTAEEETAATQLRGGDFHVYYSQDKTGTERAPRLAIRMEDGEVAEVRGIESEQNIEGIMTPIVAERVRELPGGEEYIVKARHMQTLTGIDKKTRAGEELSREDLRFLYEFDEKIVGFGYGADPRIEEARSRRTDQQSDIAVIVGLRREQVRAGDYTISHAHELADVRFVEGLLTVTGDEPMDLSECQVTARSVNAAGSGITALPRALKARVVDITDCQRIHSLPEDLDVHILQASNTPLRSLPASLKAAELRLSGCKELKSLPSELSADLIRANNSGIESIEAGVTAKTIQMINCLELRSVSVDINVEELVISGSGIKRLPRGLRVQKLSVDECQQLERLPDDLAADIVHASQSSITHIGANTNVKHLEVMLCHQLTGIPDDLTVWWLKASSSGLRSLPDGFKTQLLDINRCKHLTALPPGLVAERIHVADSAISSIAADIKVNELDVSRCKHLTALPDGMKARAVWAGDTPLIRAPENADIDYLSLPWHLEKLTRRL